MLKDFIDENHQLVILGDNFPWKELEDGFTLLYLYKGTPSKPVRMMVGLLLLKQLYGFGDEMLMPASWLLKCRNIAKSNSKYLLNRIAKEGKSFFFIFIF